MKRTAALLALLALLIPVLAVAQTPQPAVSMDLAEFLATLSGAQNTATGFQMIPCDDHSDCPAGQLCCYPCGIDGCPFICMDPDRRGRCPIIP